MDVAHQAERMSGCGKHYPILSDWNGRILVVESHAASALKLNDSTCNKIADTVAR